MRKTELNKLTYFNRKDMLSVLIENNYQVDQKIKKGKDKKYVYFFLKTITYKVMNTTSHERKH